MVTAPSGTCGPVTQILLTELRVPWALLFVIGSTPWRDLGETMFFSDASGYALLDTQRRAPPLSGA